MIYAANSYADLSSNLPSLDSLPLLLGTTNQQLPPSSRVYDQSGEHLIAILENSNARGREYLTFQQENKARLPESVVQATIATLDPGFWTSPTFDWQSTNSADRTTISRRLILDNLLKDQPSSFKSSIIEHLLAAQVVSRFGREQVLEWFLNSTYYGNLAYGVDAAARTYFGKPARSVTLTEAAILAAAAENPSINPIDAPIAALDRKNTILRHMFSQGMISSDQLNSALKERPDFENKKGFSLDIAPDFTKLVVDQVGQFIPAERIFRGGFKIISTLDYELQKQVDCTVSFQVTRLSAAGSESSDSGYENCDMARLLPSSQGLFSDPEIQSIRASALVSDPHTGQIFALVNHSNDGSNPNPRSGKPPGSILTPFIYLTAFSRGSNPATLFWDIPANLVEGYSDLQNPDGQFHGPVSARSALANDYLIPSIQILTQMGPDQVWNITKQLGLISLQVENPDGALRLPFEGGRVSLIELGQAFGVLAAQGTLAGIPQEMNPLENQTAIINPQVIRFVKDYSGNELLDCTSQISECRIVKRPVISPQLAYLVTDILSDETARWPSLGHPNPLEIGRPAAAKSGITSDQKDAWTVGYTPDLLSAVWIGTNNLNQNIVIDPNWTAGIWHAVMQYSNRENPIEEFIPPPGISEVEVCAPSGLLPTGVCPQVVSEVFINGNEPTQTDNLFKNFLINRETGRLATIFTSPALIEEKMYMLIPSEAEDWANQANIPGVPDDYDILNIDPVQSPNARIESPAMFDTIRGTIQITGRAAGLGFQSYRLQVGAGLNPSTWFQLSEGVREPVQNGVLGLWDTKGWGGLYVLQLVVLYEDETVQTSTIQVTIDNQDPEVTLRYPQDNQVLNISDSDTITILADASDDLGLQKVEIFIDNALIAAFTSPPYVLPWSTESGGHSLLVRATDRAGNISSDRINFSVER